MAVKDGEISFFLDSPVLEKSVANDSGETSMDKDAVTKVDSASIEQQGKQVILGTASYYHNRFEGRRTANGDIFRQKKLTAAHRTLPLGTRVRVTNIRKNLSVIVVINDRMGKSPHEIDLTTAAAKKLKMIRSGWTKVKIEVVE